MMPREHHYVSEWHGEQIDDQADVEQSLERKRKRRHRHSLPTRVSSACERCRHHKSRCDPFRPCLSCVRANVDCRAVPAGQPRTQHGGSRRKRRGPPRVSSISETDDHDDDGVSTTTPTRPPAPAGDSDVTLSADVHSPQSSIDCGEAESAMGIARKICELGSHHLDERTTSAIPGYRASTSAPVTYAATTGQRVPISSVLGHLLPPMELVNGLLEEYFDAVHWFSLVVYEPKFRKKLHSIADGFAYPSQRPFLMLLAVVLGMAAWYRSQRSGSDPPPERDHGGHDWRKWSTDLFKLVESGLIELMDKPSITAAQTFSLFGSYHVYHGRPNLSFSLLGATIKMSQALGMHRESQRGSFEDIEERKRVWWTIYTWDRFASITYGRPLGINDKDCNINMPADVWEVPSFVAQGADQSNSICYSSYQRELNRLYLIASPALEIIFGSRTSRSSNQLVGDEYAALVKDATQNLQKWRSRLPNQLVLDLKQDFNPDGGVGSKAYALQSLSLHLTYDNVLIVLHRPLLARQVDHLSTTTTSPPVVGNGVPAAQSTLAQTASSDLWMNAAVSTSRVTELPVLAQIATDSHLVAFLAINLFNAAIVLAVMALSEPLSDTAQDVKRTITRILRLQDLLGKRSALSKQSITVLKNVVTMLLRRESVAMLAPIAGTNQPMNPQMCQSSADPSLMSVEDTLRLPLDASLDEQADPLAGSQGGWPDASRAHRLNESLTSVQYVVAPDDRSLGMSTNGNSQNCEPVSTQTQSIWQLPVEYEWDGLGVSSSEAVEDSYHRDAEGGLYWLWDMTWNETGG